MQIALLYFPSRNKQVSKVAGLMDNSLKRAGHHISVINGEKTLQKLSIYSYILLLGTSASFFSGKIDEQIRHYLGNAGSLLGKKGYVFTLKRGFFTLKTHRFLMAAMEHEGVFLKSSEIFTNLKEADHIGEKLMIKQDGER